MSQFKSPKYTSDISPLPWLAIVVLISALLWITFYITNIKRFCISEFEFKSDDRLIGIALEAEFSGYELGKLNFKSVADFKSKYPNCCGISIEVDRDDLISQMIGNAAAEVSIRYGLASYGSHRSIDVIYWLDSCGYITQRRSMVN